jgi:hypothetical protein
MVRIVLQLLIVSPISLKSCQIFFGTVFHSGKGFPLKDKVKTLDSVHNTPVYYERGGGL